MSTARAICAAMCLPLPAVAADASWVVQGGAAYERLSNGSPDWQEVDAAVRRRLEGGTTIELGGRQAQRYGATDQELSAGVQWPLEKDWNLALRATASTAAFLPREGIAIDATRVLGAGWVAEAGLTRNRYTPTDGPVSGTTLLRLGAERYVGQWRMAAGFTQSRLDGGATAHGWRLQCDHYIGETGRIGLLAAGGRELEAAPTGVISTRVDSVVLLTRLGLAAGWSLDVDAGRTRVSGIVRQAGTASQSLPGGYHRDRVDISVQRQF
jgi:YaiO family outer membrane protein